MTKNELSVFTFESIIFLSNRDLLRLLKEVDNVTLLTACSEADILIFGCIKAALSNTAWNFFCEDLLRHPWPSERELYEAKARIGTLFKYLYYRGQLKDMRTKYPA